jgi:hypothetical protein
MDGEAAPGMTPARATLLHRLWGDFLDTEQPTTADCVPSDRVLAFLNERMAQMDQTLFLSGELRMLLEELERNERITLDDDSIYFN